MKPRIVHIAEPFGDPAARRQLSLVVGRLASEFDFHLYTLGCDAALVESLSAGDVSLAHIQLRSPADPVAGLQLRRELRKLKPRLVHTWGATAATLGRWAALSAGVGQIVVSQPSVDPASDLRRTVLDPFLNRRTAALIVDSRALANGCLEQGIAETKLRFIPPAAETPPPGARSKAQWLAELNLPADARLIAAVGTLARRKRFKELIWATDLLNVIRDDAHLILIGDGPHFERLERYRWECHVGEKVHMLDAGFDASGLLPHCEVFWDASAHDGTSHAILAAMAAGVPIVASEIAPHRELVTSGENGLLVPVGDRAGLARCARKLLDEPALARRLGEAGRRRAASDFSVEPMVAAHAALYRELLGA